MTVSPMARLGSMMYLNAFHAFLMWITLFKFLNYFSQVEPFTCCCLFTVLSLSFHCPCTVLALSLLLLPPTDTACGTKERAMRVD